MVGVILLIVGGVFLLRQLNFPMPQWLFSWQMLLIIIGLVVGIRKRFSDASAFLMILIGSIFLIDEINPAINIKQFLVPIVLGVVGLIFLFSPRMSRNKRFNARCARRVGREGDPLASSVNRYVPAEDMISDEFLDVTAVFGSVKKKVLSKTFSGGDITCVFGGCEVDLTNADFNSPLVIDCTQVFGGVKLIIPPDWEVRTDATTLFGSVEDKRPPSSGVAPVKSILIDGTMFFGGIEIKSF
jgi:predicted membrane protein